MEGYSSRIETWSKIYVNTFQKRMIKRIWKSETISHKWSFSRSHCKKALWALSNVHENKVCVWRILLYCSMVFRNLDCSLQTSTSQRVERFYQCGLFSLRILLVNDSQEENHWYWTKKWTDYSCFIDNKNWTLFKLILFLALSYLELCNLLFDLGIFRHFWFMTKSFRHFSS